MARSDAIIVHLYSVHHSIQAFDAGAWDRLAGSNAFAAYGWLLTVETWRRARIEPIYFAAHIDGMLAAGAVCYAVDRAHEVECLDDMLLGRLKKFARALAVSYQPALMCGPLLGYGWHVGTDPDLTGERAREVRDGLLAAMESEAAARGLRLGFANVLEEEEAELMQVLADRGYLRCRNVPVAALDLPWTTFAEYLADIPRKRRNEFRRQTNRHRDSGCVTALTGSARAEEERLVALLDGNALKHSALPFPLDPGFLDTLQCARGSNAEVFTTRKAGATNGVSVILVKDSMAYAAAVGIDQKESSDDFTYFEVGYNAPIAHHIGRGIRRMYYGRGLYEVKRRRGCRLMDNWVVIQASGIARAASAAWFPIASRWNRAKGARQD